jgi:ElaB/YqjD/DUF883 family membrane-anchored ribosome-binding protein
VEVGWLWAAVRRTAALPPAGLDPAGLKNEPARGAIVMKRTIAHRRERNDFHPCAICFLSLPLTDRNPMSPTAQRASTVSDIEAALDDITAKGTAAFRDAKASVDKAVSDVSEKGQEALQGARDARDTIADVVLRSVKQRPYTTLAIAGAIGFLYGAMRRR